MSSIKLNAEKINLQDLIDDLAAQMHGKDGYDSEYAAMVTQMDTLYKLKEVDSKSKVSRDTWVAVAGNLAVTLIIVGYEQKHVITSKALSLLSKLR